MKLHSNPTHFVQVVENALAQTYQTDDTLWERVHRFYEARYLNPDSKYKWYLEQYGWRLFR